MQSSHFGLLAGLWLAPSVALAHFSVDMGTTHRSRVGDGAHESIKQEPCGVAGAPRGTNIHTYRPGETITIEANEYIAHPGYFRIAFDDDGDDGFHDPETVAPLNRECMADPADHCGATDFYNNETVLMDNLNPHDYGTGLGTYRWEVTLPDVVCDTCTLQIIQVMTDPAPIHAPYDPLSPTSDDIYYQCIDLVLAEDTPEGGAPGAGGAGGLPGGDEGGTGGAAPGDPSDDEGSSAGDSSGCSVAPLSREGNMSPIGWVCTAGAILLLRRRTGLKFPAG